MDHSSSQRIMAITVRQRPGCVQLPQCPESWQRVVLSVYQISIKQRNRQVATPAKKEQGNNGQRHRRRSLHDLGDHVFLNLGQRALARVRLGGGHGPWERGRGMSVSIDREEGRSSVRLTSISSRLSCWLIQRRTFFLLLSCISPASNSSSSMKYAFWKLKMMSSSHTFP